MFFFFMFFFDKKVSSIFFVRVCLTNFDIIIELFPQKIRFSYTYELLNLLHKGHFIFLCCKIVVLPNISFDPNYQYHIENQELLLG